MYRDAVFAEGYNFTLSYTLRFTTHYHELNNS